MYVPTMCIVEIVFLEEKGRIPNTLIFQFDTVLQLGTSGLRVIDLTRDIAGAIAKVARSDVPDMPDRIIAATALHLGVPLISRDHAIQASNVTTIW